MMYNKSIYGGEKMFKSMMMKLLSAVSGIAMLSAVSSVNSACFLIIGEPDVPEKAYKLVK